jgi:tetratricopeptide (TPR) repeat protein
MAFMNSRLILLFFLSAFVATTGICQVYARQSGSRIALVIGNANYPDADAPLKETMGNTHAVADELKRLGFDVEVGENLTKEAMRAAIERFYGKIKSDSTALIFFSGYGIQSNRQTYIVPVNAQIWTEADVRRDGFNLDSILAEMNSKGARVKIAILDASRRNPFERRFRAVPAGLAPAIAPTNTAVMYSAAPSTIVRDGDSPMFVTELLKAIRTPGKIEEVFNRTLSSVSRASRGEQAPWFSSSLVEEFSFAPSATQTARPATPPPPDRELDARSEYQSAERIGTRRAWEDFLTKHPSGRYSDLARDRLAKLSPPLQRPDSDANARSEYQSAERVGTRRAWEDFLAKHPSGRYSDLARDRLAKLSPSSPQKPDPDANARNEYQSAERVGTRKAWEIFLARYPSGRYSDLARDQLAKLGPSPQKPDSDSDARSEYQSAERIGTRKAWEDFLAKYPSGRYSDLARDRLASLGKPDTRSDDPAIRELGRKLELNPNDAATYYRRGQLFAQLGDFQRAIEDFDQTLRLNPKDAEALNNRCWARALVGELQSALRDCDQALQIRPRYVDALDSRGFVSLKLGQPSKAIADYDLAIRINPRHASALYGRGIAKLRIGSTAAGNNDIAAAKAIQPAIADEFAGYGLRADSQRP